MLIPINIMAIFFSACILLALSPGPDNIFVLTQSIINGRIAGWIITLGLCTGLLGHTLLVASGVSVILHTSYVAFTSLKLSGGAYLLYLAYLSFRKSSTELIPSKSGHASLFHLYRSGIIMNVTNPKVSIFFFSFFPQFADPLRGSLMLQIVILGLLFILSALLVFGMISFFAGYLGDRLQRSLRAQTILNYISCIVYITLAVKLVISDM